MTDLEKMNHVETSLGCALTRVYSCVCVCCALTYVYSCDTSSTVRIVDRSLIPKSFFVPICNHPSFLSLSPRKHFSSSGGKQEVQIDILPTTVSLPVSILIDSKSWPGPHLLLHLPLLLKTRAREATGYTPKHSFSLIGRKMAVGFMCPDWPLPRDTSPLG